MTLANKCDVFLFYYHVAVTATLGIESSAGCNTTFLGFWRQYNFAHIQVNYIPVYVTFVAMVLGWHRDEGP